MAQHQMPAEKILKAQGLLQVDGRAGMQASQIGSGEGLRRDIGGESLRSLAVTVRQTPFTAMLSPIRTSSKGRSVVMDSRPSSPCRINLDIVPSA